MDKSYFPITGIEAVFIAQNVQDSASAYGADTPEEFAPAESGEWGEEQGSKELYYNNVLQDVYYGIKKSTITVKISGISAEKDAAIRGVYYDPTTGRATSIGNEEPPYCALGMKINKGRGDYIYIWFPKGKFSGGKVTAETKTGDVSVQTLEYTFTALATEKQFNVGGKLAGITWQKGDTTDPNFDASTWFMQVQTPETVVQPDAITMVSSVPADGAAGVAATDNVVITFNNKIANEACVIINTATGDILAAAHTFDATGKVLTLNHAQAFATGVKYVVGVSGVVDIYGQALAPVGFDFTVA